MTRPAIRLFAPLLSLGVIACGKKSDDTPGETAAAAAQVAAAIPSADTVGGSFSSADIAKLRWLVGTWKGTGDVATPFYEQYDLLNDSTLRVMGFADSTLAVANDTSVYSLRAGRFSNHERPRRYVAKVINDAVAEFIPVTANNGFVWRKKDDNSWQAVIIAPATSTRAAQERNYTMARYKR